MRFSEIKKKIRKNFFWEKNQGLIHDLHPEEKINFSEPSEIQTEWSLFQQNSAEEYFGSKQKSQIRVPNSTYRRTL